MDTGLRTSTNSVAAGAVAIAILKVASAFWPDFPVEPGYEAALTAAIMWIVARISKTQVNPGIV